MAVSPFEQVIPPFYWKKESQIGTTHFFQVTPDDPLPHYSQESQGFIDLDELKELNRSQKEILVQNICERFVFGHLNGMNGAIGYSSILKPEIIDRKLVSKYRRIATNLWGQGLKPPHHMGDDDIEILLNNSSIDIEGNQHFFEHIINPPKHEPNLKNTYLSNEAMAFHDARMLDRLITELYLEPSKHINGFSKN